MLHKLPTIIFLLGFNACSLEKKAQGAFTLETPQQHSQTALHSSRSACHFIQENPEKCLKPSQSWFGSADSFTFSINILRQGSLKDHTGVFVLSDFIVALTSVSEDYSRGLS